MVFAKLQLEGQIKDIADTRDWTGNNEAYLANPTDFQGYEKGYKSSN